MKLEEFDYTLPEDLIAQEPLLRRDDSRLLVLDKKNGQIRHKKFRDILEFINPGDLLVLNDSRVIPARLFGKKKTTGGRVEVFLLKRVSQKKWEVLVKPGKRIKPGDIIIFKEGFLEGEILADTPVGGRIIEFFYKGDFSSVLKAAGKTPLPPYIKKELPDSSRYQTVYAKTPGSVAAPTAGFHFTEELLTEIKKRGIDTAYVTLHVGLGTFRPVEVDDITKHDMHSEYYEIPPAAMDAVNEKKAQGKNIIAVGTTSCRVLESSGRAGLPVKSEQGLTDLFIYPGYDFKVIDALLTNFHLPKSTLLMLVSALAGKENIMNAYNEAVKGSYRFYSFGDAMLIR